MLLSYCKHFTFIEFDITFSLSRSFSSFSPSRNPALYSCNCFFSFCLMSFEVRNDKFCAILLNRAWSKAIVRIKWTKEEKNTTQDISPCRPTIEYEFMPNIECNNMLKDCPKCFFWFNNTEFGFLLMKQKWNGAGNKGQKEKKNKNQIKMKDNNVMDIIHDSFHMSHFEFSQGHKAHSFHRSAFIRNEWNRIRSYQQQ